MGLSPLEKALSAKLPVFAAVEHVLGRNVTAVVAENMSKGDATVCKMSKIAHADVIPIDIGMLKGVEGVRDCHVMRGTKNFYREAAMTREQCEQAIDIGRMLVREYAERGYDLFATGEMGIGNTTTTSAVASVLLGLEPEKLTGKGAGLSDAGLVKKVRVIRESIGRLKPDPHDAIDVLSKVGGLDIAGMCGAFIGGAEVGGPGLIDGEDKQKFYIFDFCGNFEFFRMNKGKATANMIALQGAIFNLKFDIAYKLQDISYQVDRLIAYRDALVKQMTEKVRELPRDNFAVRQHLKYVDLYSDEKNYNALTYEDTLLVREEVAPLILPDKDEASAVRFDALMYGIELAYLIGKKYTRARSDLMKRVAGIANVANVPEIQAQSDLIGQILHTDYIANAGINEFEEIRERLRDLMKYILKTKLLYNTNFDDDLLSIDWRESELENDELKNYKAKAEYYIRQHQDTIAIAKLRTNQPLTEMDVASLEKILWNEIGTKQDYEQEFGTKPLGEFVREIVGLDMNAAKEAFSEYLTNADLDSRQIYFVNQIIEYIVHNGMMKDLSVLQEAPFTDRGSVAEVFTDLAVWMGIRKVINQINENAVA